MVDGLFVTGGTGFVGRRLLKALPARWAGPSSRSNARWVRRRGNAGVHQVAGDLLEPATYAAALSKCRTVLHLAAATGRAAAAEHLRMNAGGTARLLAAAKTAGVSSSSSSVPSPRHFRIRAGTTTPSPSARRKRACGRRVFPF